jgi:methylaspartate ammonia-lyase
MNNATVTIERVRLAAGIGGYWVQDQPAIQTQAEPDGFFFRGEPVSPGFRQIREPSEAYCVLLTLADGETVFGDCVTVLNAGHAGRPAPLHRENMAAAQRALERIYEGHSFATFKEAAAALDGLALPRGLAIPVAYGVSQALLAAFAAARRTPMAFVLIEEYGLPRPTHRPGFAGSGGGDWRNNVDKAIARRLAMFPQSAIQTRAHCEDLPEFVSWIRGRIERLAGPDYRPDLHFDFHATLGRVLDNDESRIADYFAGIVERAAPCAVFFEDPFVAGTAEEAIERMASLKTRLDAGHPPCFLIADEWANGPGQVARFAAARAAHAIQTKMPDNGSITNAMDAIRACHDHGVLSYLGGSCNETDLSARATVHVGLALGVWRMLTKPGLGFDEGLMVMTNEMSRTLAQLGLG